MENDPINIDRKQLYFRREQTRFSEKRGSVTLHQNSRTGELGFIQWSGQHNDWPLDESGRLVDERFPSDTCETRRIYDGIPIRIYLSFRYGIGEFDSDSPCGVYDLHWDRYLKWSWRRDPEEQELGETLIKNFRASAEEVIDYFDQRLLAEGITPEEGAPIVTRKISL